MTKETISRRPLQTGTINNRTMQRSNLALVLRTIYDNGGISRRDVAARTGLTPSTVTNIVNRLLSDGLVHEDSGAGAESGAVGRRPIRLTVNAARYACIGVELSADRITGVLTDFCGAPLARMDTENDYRDAPETAVARIGRVVRALMRDAGMPRESVLGVGLLSAGPYDREAGVMLDQTNFEGWTRVPIRDLAREETGLPVYFDRDSVGCALDAVAAGGEHDGTLFALLVNTIGIGGALVIDGEVFYGRENCASEVGCMTMIPGGPQCRCGDKGCLEAISAADALLGYIRGRVAEGAEDPFDGGADRADASALAAAYRAGRPLAVEAVLRGARYLGVAIGNVIKIVGPDVIAIGGSFVAVFPEYYDLMVGEAVKRRQVQPRFVPFRHGPIQCAMGGVRLVVQEYFRSLEE